MGLFNWLFRRSKPKKIKLGLALGSGGAKGFAHLGALKAFEENGIEFDVVAGTSIGSIVGAFYAAGYSSVDISEMLSQIVDLSEIKNLFMSRMDTSGIFKLIDREIGYMNVEDLSKPFVAVATELDTGKEHVFRSGNVSMALSASSSMQPYFKPVVIDGVRYIDGAYTNSVPADLVKEMGADYVVGIDLSTRDIKKGIISRFFPSYKSEVKEPWSKGYQYSDTILHPDLNDFSPVAFWQGSKMYDIGYNHALSFIPKIKEDVERLTFRNKKR